VYDAGGRRPPVLPELWQHRELLTRLVSRNLKMRYQRSVLGFLWALLNPLVTILILVGVFRYVIRIGVADYWAFLVSGYFVWVFVQHAVATSAGVITDHSYMTRSLAFPAEILVLSSVLARLVEFMAELALVVMALAVFQHHGIPPSMLLLPVVVAITLLLAIGLALPIAAGAVFFKDIQHAVPVALMMLGYLSPVFYPMSLVPERFRAIYLLNPVAALLTLYHEILYEGRLPSLALLSGSVAMSVIICVAGVMLFRRQRALFAEII
jgi:lipopolysaccharide transport system permease protein